MANYKALLYSAIGLLILFLNLGTIRENIPIISSIPPIILTIIGIALVVIGVIKSTKGTNSSSNKQNYQQKEQRKSRFSFLNFFKSKNSRAKEQERTKYKEVDVPIYKGKQVIGFRRIAARE